MATLCRLFLRFISQLAILVTAGHSVHQLHDLSDCLCIDGVLKTLHMRHLLKNLTKVFSLVNVNE